MANEEHLKILKQGVKKWNKWRVNNFNIEPDISWTNLSGFDLSGVYLWGANLSHSCFNGANFSNASLDCAKLGRADLSNANFNNASLKCAALARANLKNANLSNADLRYTDFAYADLSGSCLCGANLMGSVFVLSNLSKTDLTNCRIYGISAWSLNLNGSTQKNLIISHLKEPIITVDNLEVAQFIYLLIHNEKIKNVIDTITAKAVLILGNFSPKRKLILEVIREELRHRDYLPILFDFDKPTDRDFTETVMTLAGLSKFIITDISEPKSTPLEIQAMVPNFMVPFVPLIKLGEKPFSMFIDIQTKHDWVLETVSYKDKEDLTFNFERAIVKRAEEKYQELKVRKLRELQAPISIDKFKQQS